MARKHHEHSLETTYCVVACEIRQEAAFGIKGARQLFEVLWHLLLREDAFVKRHQSTRRLLCHGPGELHDVLHDLDSAMQHIGTLGIGRGKSTAKHAYRPFNLFSIYNKDEQSRISRLTRQDTGHGAQPRRERIAGLGRLLLFGSPIPKLLAQGVEFSLELGGAFLRGFLLDWHATRISQAMITKDVKKSQAKKDSPAACSAASRSAPRVDFNLAYHATIFIASWTNG